MRTRSRSSGGSVLTRPSLDSGREPPYPCAVRLRDAPRRGRPNGRYLLHLIITAIAAGAVCCGTVDDLAAIAARDRQYPRFATALRI